MAEVIINTIYLSVLVILETALYLMLAGRVLPRIVKIRYSLSETRDRGLKKYVYPSGRGICYEPRPDIRKYMPRYLLFTNNGYKYVKCLLDKEINSIGYTVVMFNNRDEVIDTVDVTAKRSANNETAALLVHEDTSYVDISLFSINGTAFEKERIAYCRLRDLLIYTAAMTVLCFIETVFVMKMLNLLFSWWAGGKLWADINTALFILPAIFIGLLCGLMALLNARAKKVRWSK